MEEHKIFGRRWGVIRVASQSPREDKAKGQRNNRNVWRTMKFGKSAVSTGLGVVVDIRDGKGTCHAF